VIEKQRMLTGGIEVLFDVVLASSVIFLYNGSVGIFMGDFNFLLGCFIVSLGRVLEHDRLLLHRLNADHSLLSGSPPLFLLVICVIFALIKPLRTLPPSLP
jgi:hypothetical protein